MTLYEVRRNYTFSGGEKVSVRSGMYASKEAADAARALETRVVRKVAGEVTTGGMKVLEGIIGDIFGITGIALEVRALQVSLVDTPTVPQVVS